MQTVIDRFGWTFTVGFCLLFGLGLAMLCWSIWIDWIKPKVRPPVPARPVPGCRHLQKTTDTADGSSGFGPEWLPGDLSASLDRKEDNNGSRPTTDTVN